jgi:hypothetical protein
MSVYLVPVRESALGTLALRTGRLPSGERVGLAFTSEPALRLTLGPRQHWARLSGDAFTGMLAQISVGQFRIDPLPAGELDRSTPHAA